MPVPIAHNVRFEGDDYENWYTLGATESFVMSMFWSCTTKEFGIARVIDDFFL